MVDLNRLITVAVAGYCKCMDHKSFTPVEISHAREIRNYFTNVRDLLQSFEEISSSDKSLVPDTNAQYVINLL